MTNFQWLLIFFILFCYASYVGLVCVWLLLGAIINPNNFLVYSTAALTFLTFLSSKYQAFQKISDDGFKMIKDQVFNIIQGQIKLIIGFMIEEVKELTVIGKDLMQSDVAKFAFEKADSLGLGEEVAAIKSLTEKTLENPDKLALSVASSFLNNPNMMITKLKQAEEALKDKAIAIFKTKCKSNNIPEELIDIFLSLNFKDEEKLKLSLSQLVENKSEEILGQKLNSQLIKSILDVIIHPKDIKNPKELATIVTQELVANIIELFLIKAIKESKDEDLECLGKIKDFREVILSIFSLVAALKSKNTKVSISEMRKFMKFLSLDSSESKKTTQIFDLLDIIMNMKSPAQYKQKILLFLDENMAGEKVFFELMATAVFSSPDEQFHDFGRKKYIKNENIKEMLVNILNLKPMKGLDSKLVGTIGSFCIKALKNQIDSNDIEEAAKIGSEFINEALKENGLNKKEVGKELVKLLQIAPLFFYYGKNPSSFWGELANKYNIDINSIKEIIHLISENYWQNFSFSRIEALSESLLLSIISSRIKMTKEELLGFLAIFYGEYEHFYVDDFLTSLMDYEKPALPQQLRPIMKNLINILFCSKDGFYIYSQLLRMKVLEKDALNFLKERRLLDLATINALGLKEEDISIPLIIESKDNDEFIRQLLSAINLNEQLNEVISFLKRILTLFALKNIPKNHVRRNIDIKNSCSSFAEQYKYDTDGLELLLYMLMGDYDHTIRGFQYFLKDQTEFPFKLSSYKQIIRTILNEDSLLKGSEFKKYVDKWLPNEGKSLNEDFLALSFGDLLWYGFDCTPFLQRLATIGLELESKEAKAINSWVFSVLHLAEIQTKTRDIQVLFPILKGEELEGEILNVIKEDLEEEVLFQEEDPIITESDPLIKEKMNKKEFSEFKKQFFGSEGFTDMILGENIYYKSVYECFFKREEAPEKGFPDWRSSETVRKYFMLFEFLNYKPKGLVHLNEVENLDNELRRYFKETLSFNEKEPMEFNDFNRVIKYFFTTDYEVFARGLIQNFNEFHGKLSELIDLFSISSLEPSIESLTNILGLSTYQVESSFNICRFFYTKDRKKQLELLSNNEKWFKKLSIDFGEFSLLFRLLTNELNLYDFPKFLSAFTLNKHINSKILTSLFALFAKTDAFSDDFESFLKISTERGVIFKELGIDTSFGDLLCDINEGNFWNLKNIIQCNKKLSAIKIFPAAQQNPKNIIETISAFVGMVSNNTRPTMKIEELYTRFSARTIKCANNQETIAYLLYRQFNLSPLMTLLTLEDSNAKNLSRKLDKNLYVKLKHIMKALEMMSLKERNQLAEAEFRFYVDDMSNEEYSSGSGVKDKGHFYRDLLEKRRIFSQTSSIIEEKRNGDEEEVKEEEFKEDSYNNIDLLDAARNLNLMGRIINKNLLKVYEKEKITEEKNPDIFLAINQSVSLEKSQSSEEEDNYIGVYFIVIETFAKMNSLGAPISLHDTFHNELNGLSRLIMLVQLKNMREIFVRKNKEEEEDNQNQKKKRLNEEGYKNMVIFGLEFDLLLVTMEKLKFLNEEFECFKGFDKNALLKFMIPVFFFEDIEENNDFLLEFFFRNSLFEDDLMDKLDEELEKIKRKKVSSIEKISRIFYESDIPKAYFSEGSIDENIENYLNFGVENIKTYEEFSKALDEERLILILHPCKRTFLSHLRNWKNTNREKYLQLKYNSYEALEDYYPLESIEKNANITAIEAEYEDLMSKKADFFFSSKNYEEIRKVPLFQKALDFNKGLKLTEMLNGVFKESQMLKSEAGKGLFTNLLILFKEKSKVGKKGSKALEYILAKISFGLKSNYNNLRMMIEFLLQNDIKPSEFELCLSKLEIEVWGFYGLGILHFKMAATINGGSTSIFMNNVPHFIMQIYYPVKEMIRNDKKKKKVVFEIEVILILSLLLL